METILGIAGGIIFVLVGLWLGARRADSTLPPELREAMRLEKSDPARSQFLADTQFERAARQDQAERAQLWERAPHDLAAAEELRRRFLEDLETDRQAARELRKTAGADFLRSLEHSQQNARDQIAKLETMIRGLRLP